MTCLRRGNVTARRAVGVVAEIGGNKTAKERGSTGVLGLEIEPEAAKTM
jgi:hypothetical protein